MLLFTALGVARPAAAEELGFAGTLSLEFPALPPVAVSGLGVAGVDTDGGGAALRWLSLAGGVSGSARAPVTDPDLTEQGVAGISLQLELGSGRLGPFGPPGPAWEPQLTRNALPVRGLARVCLLSAQCNQSLDVRLSAADGASGIGVGGMLFEYFGASTRISVEAAPWTIRTVSVWLSTSGGGSAAYPAHGWLHGPQSFTQSTALTDGALSLVTPMQVTSQTGQWLSGSGRLELRFLPEPGRGLLLGSGVLALLLMGRRRQRVRP